MSRFAIEVEDRSFPHQIIVRLIGEADLASASRFSEIVLDGVVRRRPSEIVLDLSSLTFLDSTGLYGLIQLNEAARSGGTDVVFWRPSEAVIRLIDIAGVREQFTLSDEQAPPPDGS